jgi:hypothetical protein
MKRREFLIDSSRGALGFGALALTACAASAPPAAKKDAYLESLVATWEARIPQWLQETKMPAVSIAIVRDGSITRPAFPIGARARIRRAQCSRFQAIWPDFAKRFLAV